MSRRFSSALAGFVVLGLAAASFADPSVASVTPSEGTVGTTFDVVGTELGTVAPKVALKLHGDATAKPIPVKLTRPFDGTTIHCTVMKCQPGVFDVVVTPRGKTAITVDSAFTGRAPNVTSLDKAKYVLGETMVINGTFFGTKKAKVRINNVLQKVKIWTDAQITLVLSKKTGEGDFNVDVYGAGGTQTGGAQANFVAPLAGGDHFTARFDGGLATLTQTNKTQTFVADNVITFLVQATKLSGFVARSMTITVGAALDEGTYTNGQILVIYSAPSITNPLSYTSQNAPGWTLTITQRVGNRVKGTFSGGLVRTTGNGPNAVNVTGDFTLTIK